MKMRTVRCLALAACLAASFVEAGTRAVADYKIAFKAKADAVEDAGSFIVEDGSQSNYVSNGTIVNCLPKSTDDGRVNVVIQFEMSGAGGKFQLQTHFTAELDRAIVVVDERGKRLELTITRAGRH